MFPVNLKATKGGKGRGSPLEPGVGLGGIFVCLSVGVHICM